MAQAQGPPHPSGDGQLNERDAETLLAVHLANAGVRVERQVRFGSKVVDLVVGVTGQSAAIEVKLHDWRRGASQAYLNGVYFRHSYVAIPTRTAAFLDLDLLEELGVGAIAFDADGYSVVYAAGDPALGFPDTASLRVSAE